MGIEPATFQLGKMVFEKDSVADVLIAGGNSPSIQQSGTNTPALKGIPLLRVDGRPLGEWP